MGERKVLNRYFPPDFDPAALPKRKRADTNDMKVRMMLPMSVRCKTCGNFMYKGTKFNTRKEDVMGETYLGIQIFRFYYRCTNCAAEFTMKTDPKNSDYQLEEGATRNYEHWREEEKTKAEAIKTREEEEMGNAMKALENRTLESKREMDIMAALDEMRALNARHAKITTEEALAALMREADKTGDGGDVAGGGGGQDVADDLAEFYRLKRAAAKKLQGDDDSDDDGGEDGGGQRGGAGSSSRAAGGRVGRAGRSAGVGLSLAAAALEEELQSEEAGDVAGGQQGQSGLGGDAGGVTGAGAPAADGPGVVAPGGGDNQVSSTAADPLAAAAAQVKSEAGGSGATKGGGSTSAVVKPVFKVVAKPKAAAVTKQPEPAVPQGAGLGGLLGYGSSEDSQ